MNADRRSPWVVLGLPFPSSKAHAKRAFACRSRDLKKGAGLPWTQEDLAWADAEITLSSDNPESTVAHYRIPADPAALERPREGDLFVPAQRLLPRSSEPPPATAVDDRCAGTVLAHIRNWLGALETDDQFQPYGEPSTRDQGAPL